MRPICYLLYFNDITLICIYIHCSLCFCCSLDGTWCSQNIYRQCTTNNLEDIDK
uniref:Uncharacterized protein n=1 Tax=Anguilla anguilla TaxID=7936 RepID=A0A0E9VIE6_ANGAN